MRRCALVLSLTTLLACAAPAEPPAPRITRGLTVCQVEGQSLLGDLYQPPAGAHRRRALLFVHGGGWSTGSRADYEALARNLARLGYTGLSVDYRLAPAVHHPAPLEDLKCALRWLRSQAAAWEVDGQKLAVIGGSAGAHLAALLAYTPDDPRFEGRGLPRKGSTRVAAAVLHGGPYDLSALAGASAQARGTVQALLGTRSPTALQLREASPTHYVRHGAVPSLILHGELDPVVPVEQAYRLAAAGVQVNAPGRLIVIPGAGHADFGRDPDAIGRALVEFLAQSLP
ncbi:alpha/beta hydrolase [Inhella sp.]|uniref:alpha/beta hydrolase n=1 Tax=Inhella sp. TaxID=1921806 RepID=UPI0035B20B8E